MDRISIKRAQLRETLGGDRSGTFRVAHTMTTEPTCISPEASVLDLVELFHARQFRHALVVDNEQQLIGVVSDRDVLRCFGPAEGPKRSVLAEIRVEEIMSSDLVTVQPQTSLETAVAMMVAEGISCLPVLNGPILVGILTNTDLHVVLQIFLQSSLAESTVALARDSDADGSMAR